MALFYVGRMKEYLEKSQRDSFELENYLDMKGHPKKKDKIDKMMSINSKQKEFYEIDDKSLEEKGNIITRIWRNMRRRQQRVRKNIGIDRQVYRLHKKWIGDISKKYVLDLGCHSGNLMSIPLAKSAKRYLGVDLSKSAVKELQKKIDNEGIVNAETKSVDFLSRQFPNEKFDIVYAHSVVHHFEHIEVFLEKLYSHVKKGGRVITRDPLKTSLPVLIARKIYRPFQADSSWEWPFTRDTFRIIQEYFEISDLRGTLGRAKWAIPLSVISEDVAAKLGRKWHKKDFQKAKNLNKDLWRCMQVTMCLEK